MPSCNEFPSAIVKAPCSGRGGGGSSASVRACSRYFLERGASSCVSAPYRLVIFHRKVEDRLPVNFIDPVWRRRSNSKHDFCQRAIHLAAELRAELVERALSPHQVMALRVQDSPSYLSRCACARFGWSSRPSWFFLEACSASTNSCRDPKLRRCACRALSRNILQYPADRAGAAMNWLPRPTGSASKRPSWPSSA